MVIVADEHHLSYDQTLAACSLSLYASCDPSKVKGHGGLTPRKHMALIENKAGNRPDSVPTPIEKTVGPMRPWGLFISTSAIPVSLPFWSIAGPMRALLRLFKRGVPLKVPVSP